MGNVKPLIMENPTGSTQTISKMLQGKKFRGLTKSVTGFGDVYYELWGQSKGRLFYVKFILLPDGLVETTVGSEDPTYFDMVEAVYNSLDGFEKIGFDKSDTEAVKGKIKTKFDKEQVAQLFHALEKSYNKVS